METIALISGPIGAYRAPQLANNWKGGGLIWVAWGRMGPHRVGMGLAWGRTWGWHGAAWGRMGLAWGRMGPHGPHGPAWGYTYRTPEARGQRGTPETETPFGVGSQWGGVAIQILTPTDLRPPNRTPAWGAYRLLVPTTSRRWAGGRSTPDSTAGTWSAQMGKKASQWYSGDSKKLLVLFFLWGLS